MITLTGLMHAWAQAGVAAQLRRRLEAVDVADLRGDRVANHPSDPRSAHQQRHVLVVGAEMAPVVAAVRLPFLFGVTGRELLDRLEVPEPWRGTIDASLQPIEDLDGQIGSC